MLERSLLFGPTSNLVGTICIPGVDIVRRRVGILLFNAGVIHRVGPHRINVRLARALAKDGFASIRFDLSGQGDSPRPHDNRSPKEQVIDDIQAAMNVMTEACLINDFLLFGFCSGGYHGFDALAADSRIKALVMFDAFLYPTVKSALNRYRMRIAEKGLPRACLDWALGQLRLLQNRLGNTSTKSVVADNDRSAYRLGIPSRSEFAKAMNRNIERGVKVHIIYAGQNFEKYSYGAQFADAFRNYGIADRVTTHFFPDMDHAVTDLAAQRDLVDHVRRWAINEMATS